MTKSTTLPPDITVTRADVLALPIVASSTSTPSPAPGDIVVPGAPHEDHVWSLLRVTEKDLWAQPWQIGRLVWAEVAPNGDAWNLCSEEAAIAERAFLWQTALASDAALADIGNDPAPSAPPTASADDADLTLAVKHLTPAQRVEVEALVAHAQKMRDALTDTALRAAIRRVSSGTVV